MSGNGVLELGTFEEVQKDGVPLKFKVTTVPPHLYDTVVNHMTDYFFPREPMSAYFSLHEDPKSVQAVRGIWKELLSGGASLVAIREGPEPEKDRVVGANVTFISSKVHDKPEELKGTKFEKVYDAVMDITNRVDVYEKYGVESYLSAFGLSVSPGFHGFKIGERLLQCRKPLCKALGVKITATVFTNPISILLSKKVGFVPVVEVDYSTYEYNGEVVFKGKEGPLVLSVWDFS